MRVLEENNQREEEDHFVITFQYTMGSKNKALLL